MPRRYDRANSGRLQEGRGRGAPKFARDGLSVPPARQKMQRHEIVREIIIRPNFRPATAVLNCDKESLRWPGPFSPGFLSPQPPGAVGIGPVRRNSLSPSWANASWSFFFLGGGRHSPTRQLARLRARAGASEGAGETNEPEIQTTIRSMDSAPAHPRCAIALRE